MENMETKLRVNDIKALDSKAVKVHINSVEKMAYEGETILSTLLAYGINEISKNDYNQKVGAYCGMGICFCCTVSVNNSKRKACKTIVREGMHINTLLNTHDLVEQYANEKNI